MCGLILICVLTLGLSVSCQAKTSTTEQEGQSDLTGDVQQNQSADAQQNQSADAQQNQVADAQQNQSADAQQNQVADAQHHQATDVKARVEAIYADVATTYNRCNEQGDMQLLQETNFDEKYCSSDWNEAQRQAMAVYDEDDGPLFDYDYWVSGQDFQNVSASDVKVIKLEADKAVVTLNVHNCGTVTAIRLELVYERNNWFIDNMTSERDGEIGVKDYLKTVVSNAQQQ